MQTQTHSANSFNPEFGYAGFWRRLAALLVDSLIIGLITSPFSYKYTTYLSSSDATSSSSSVSPWAIIIGAAYVIFFWVKQNGQTLGKKALGVKIVKEDGSDLDLTSAIVRYLSYTLSSILFLGYISAAANSKKQAWHDKIAKTVVVKTDSKSRTAFVALAVILISFFFIIMLAALSLGIYAGFKGRSNVNIKNNVATQIGKSSSALPSDLSDQVFNLVNQKRVQNNLKELTFDNKLCAYAQRRLSNFKDNQNKYDDARGLYEDLANAEMSRAYFSAYRSAGESPYILSSSSTSSDVVAVFTNSTNSIVSNPSITHACVRNDDNFLIMVNASTIK